MKRINVVIINGKPRSGKDTVVKYIKEWCDVDECADVVHRSTINPVKQALSSLGVYDDSNKDEVTRSMLAELKQLWIKKCDGPLRLCMDIIFEQANSRNTNDVIIIFQIREPDEIDKLKNAIKPISKAYNVDVSTLFVNRFPLPEEYENEADKNVSKYVYDAEIINNGTLVQLRDIVYKYMRNLMGGK